MRTIPTAQKTPIAGGCPLAGCWPLWFRSETATSDHASADCYRLPEDIGVVPVVVAELKFRDVQRQILGADLVERADDPALNQRPEAFNRLGVDRAVNVFLGAM